VYATAAELYDALGLVRPRIRLVGVRAEGLSGGDDHTHQLAFGERKSGWREAEFAMDKASRRFGSDAVQPASLVSRVAKSGGGTGGGSGGGTPAGTPAGTGGRKRARPGAKVPPAASDGNG
jgi:DNA polymerase-4